jgi:serine/threonine-protein kinase
MTGPALSLVPEAQQDFGRYRLLCRFATGGMANLYLAQLIGTQGFEKVVAIKQIHEHLTENRDFLQMFIDEARLCARITHPNVVQVIELGQIDNSHFIAMEYVEGETLAALTRRTTPELGIVARVIANAAAGLHAAHQLTDENGELLYVVHRDVSPQNILISYEGMVKVADFGVALARGNLHSTSAGQIKGKFAYMAPEQVQQDGVVDHRSDIFALGIVLWELATGHRLFKAQNDAATVTKVKEMEISSPSSLVADFPASLDAVVMRALERDPDRRFQTAEEMEEALDEVLVEMRNPVQRRHIAAMMQETFKDRIDAKRQLMIKCEDSKELITASSTLGSHPSVSIVGPTMTQGMATLARSSTRRSAVIGVIVVATALALVVAVMLVLASSRDRRQPAAKPEASPASAKATTPRTIQLQIRALPPEAVITVGGEKVSNPFELKREPGAGELDVEISAPDHTPQRFKVPLAESGRWMISLVRADEPSTKKAKKPVRRKLDEDLFGDPYK